MLGDTAVAVHPDPAARQSGASYAGCRRKRKGDRPQIDDASPYGRASCLIQLRDMAKPA